MKFTLTASVMIDQIMHHGIDNSKEFADSLSIMTDEATKDKTKSKKPYHKPTVRSETLTRAGLVTPAVGTPLSSCDGGTGGGKKADAKSCTIVAS